MWLSFDQMKIKLTNVQADVLEMVLEGFTYREIAKELKYSPVTVAKSVAEMAEMGIITKPMRGKGPKAKSLLPDEAIVDLLQKLEYDGEEETKEKQEGTKENQTYAQKTFHLNYDIVIKYLVERLVNWNFERGVFFISITSISVKTGLPWKIVAGVLGRLHDEDVIHYGFSYHSQKNVFCVDQETYHKLTRLIQKQNVYEIDGIKFGCDKKLNIQKRDGYYYIQVL